MQWCSERRSILARYRSHLHVGRQPRSCRRRHHEPGRGRRGRRRQLVQAAAAGGAQHGGLAAAVGAVPVPVPVPVVRVRRRAVGAAVPVAVVAVDGGDGGEREGAGLPGGLLGRLLALADVLGGGSEKKGKRGRVLGRAEVEERESRRQDWYCMDNLGN